MPDVTSPFLLPYPEDTDLVRDGASDIQALAEAVNDAGVDGKLGGLVVVKNSIKTDTQVQSAVAAGASFDVTGISITHTLSNAANKLVLFAYFGAAASGDGRGQVSLAIAEDGNLIQIGDSASDRTRATAGGAVAAGTTNVSFVARVVTMPHVSILHSPGDTSAHTYTLRAINAVGTAQDVYINRSVNDSDSASRVRATSGLTLMEVRV
jgi:hypothetical protein